MTWWEDQACAGQGCHDGRLGKRCADAKSASAWEAVAERERHLWPQRAFCRGKEGTVLDGVCAACSMVGQCFRSSEGEGEGEGKRAAQLVEFSHGFVIQGLF